MLINFRERGREGGTERERKRERDIDVRENHLSVVSCTHPNWGLNPPPGYVP